jgi:hypothetical protein
VSLAIGSLTFSRSVPDPRQLASLTRDVCSFPPSRSHKETYTSVAIFITYEEILARLFHTKETPKREGGRKRIREGGGRTKGRFATARGRVWVTPKSRLW